MKISRRNIMLGTLATALAGSLPARVLAQALPPASDAIELPFGLGLEGGSGTWPSKTDLTLTRNGKAIGAVAEAATRVAADGEQQIAASTVMVDTDPVNGGLLATTSGVVAAGQVTDVRFVQIKPSLVGLRPGGALAASLGIPAEILGGPLLSASDIVASQTEGNWDATCDLVTLELAAVQAALPMLGVLFSAIGASQLAISNIRAAFITRAQGADRSLSITADLAGRGADGAETVYAGLKTTHNVGEGETGTTYLSGTIELEDRGLTALLREKGGSMLDFARSVPVLTPSLAAFGWNPADAATDAGALSSWLSDGGRLLLIATPTAPLPVSKLASYSLDLGSLPGLVKDTGLRIERRG